MFRTGRLLPSRALYYVRLHKIEASHAYLLRCAMALLHSRIGRVFFCESLCLARAFLTTVTYIDRPQSSQGGLSAMKVGVCGTSGVRLMLLYRCMSIQG